MSDNDQETTTQLQTVLSRLLQQRLDKSLKQLDEHLGAWRRGELGVFEAHAEVLKHAARAERLATRVAKAGFGGATTLLRDAFDEGLISRAEFVELTGDMPESVEPSGPGIDDGLSLPLKRDLVRELLEQGPVLVHVDAQVSGVSVPERLAEDPKLVLRFGYGLSPEIPDLEVDETAITGTLTFGGVPHRCVLPWPAVYAVVSEIDQRGMVWPEDVPRAVLQDMHEQNPLPEAGPQPAVGIAKEDKPAKRRAGHLKLVD